MWKVDDGFVCNMCCQNGFLLRTSFQNGTKNIFQIIRYFRQQSDINDKVNFFVPLQKQLIVRKSILT